MFFLIFISELTPWLIWPLTDLLKVNSSRHVPVHSNSIWTTNSSSLWTWSIISSPATNLVWCPHTHWSQLIWQTHVKPNPPTLLVHRWKSISINVPLKAGTCGTNRSQGLWPFVLNQTEKSRLFIENNQTFPLQLLPIFFTKTISRKQVICLKYLRSGGLTRWRPMESFLHF